jgi:hypothetical protein
MNNKTRIEELNSAGARKTYRGKRPGVEYSVLQRPNPP